MWLQWEDYSQQFKDPEESVKNLIKIRTAKRSAGGDEGQLIIWWGCAKMLLSAQMIFLTWINSWRPD